MVTTAVPTNQQAEQLAQKLELLVLERRTDQILEEAEVLATEVRKILRSAKVNEATKERAIVATLAAMTLLMTKPDLLVHTSFVSLYQEQVQSVNLLPKSDKQSPKPVKASPAIRDLELSLEQIITAGNNLFENPKSIGAIAIGHAEGNYDVEGNPNANYYGHLDPGNGVKNIGFCSDQGRGGGNLARADQACLKYNKRAIPDLSQRFKDAGITPTTFEFLVAIDLHNQANPRHAKMFPKKLVELKEKYREKDIVEYVASTRAATFWVNGRNTAGGLLRACRMRRNPPPDEWSCVYDDQLRRVRAIARALQHNGVALNAPLIAATSQPSKSINTKTSKFHPPLPGILDISSPFGKRISPITGKLRPHDGIDFRAATGTPILAVADGRVIKAGYHNDGLGFSVEIKHLDGKVTVYGHASKVHVSRGQKVTAGQTIAEVGSTGNSTGPHLHLELYVDEKAVDPLPYLNL